MSHALKLPDTGSIIAMASPRSTGKTTNTAWTLQALHDDKRTVYGFDCDDSHQLADWHEVNEWGFPVVVSASIRANVNIRSTVPAGAWAVADVGHLENHRDIGLSVASVADLLILNCAPTLSDIERLEGLPALTDPDDESRVGFIDATGLSRGGTPIPTVVLLSRAPGTARADVAEARNILSDSGLTVLDTAVPHQTRYARTGAGVDLNTSLGTKQQCAHADMLVELAEKGYI